MTVKRAAHKTYDSRDHKLGRRKPFHKPDRRPCDPQVAAELASEDSYALLAHPLSELREPMDHAHRPAHEVYDIAQARISGDTVYLPDHPRDHPDNDDTDDGESWASAFIDGNYGFKSN